MHITSITYQPRTRRVSRIQGRDEVGIGDKFVHVDYLIAGYDGFEGVGSEFGDADHMDEHEDSECEDLENSRSEQNIR